VSRISTPIDQNLPPPAEMLYDRPIRSQLPLYIKPSSKITDHMNLLHEKQESQKYYYDKGTCELSNLSPGDLVMLQSPQDLK
jgi:hypothetical protein